MKFYMILAKFANFSSKLLDKKAESRVIISAINSAQGRIY